MKKTFLKFALGFFALSTLTFTACNPDDDNSNEEEVITKVTLTLKDAAGKESIFTWNDPDGANGAQKPTIDNINLAANTSYTGTIKLENGTTSPATDITAEVQKESTAHILVYTASNISVEITDKDTNGKPLGIATKVTTKAATTDKLRVQLKHEPTDKNNAQNPGGATDVDVEFPVIVK
jgi:hypothetical protein